MARKPPLSSPIPPPPKVPDASKQSSRTGKRAVAFWVDEASYEEFQIATVRLRTTIQAAGEDMLAAWMHQHGMKLPER